MTEISGSPEFEQQQRSKMDKSFHAFADNVEDIGLAQYDPEKRAAIFFISERKFSDLTPYGELPPNPPDRIKLALGLRTLISAAEDDLGVDFDHDHSNTFQYELGNGTTGEAEGYFKWSILRIAHTFSHPDYPEGNPMAQGFLRKYHAFTKRLVRQDIDPNYDPDTDPNRAEKWSYLQASARFLGQVASHISTPPLA